MAALELAEQGYGLQAGEEDDDRESDRIIDRPLSRIQRRDIQWLWQDRIAVGEFTVVRGDPGIGKSFLSCDIAARISQGSRYPDGAACQKGTVLLISCEDGADDTLRPQLEEHGVRLPKVRFLTVQTYEGG